MTQFQSLILKYWGLVIPEDAAQRIYKNELPHDIFMLGELHGTQNAEFLQKASEWLKAQR